MTHDLNHVTYRTFKRGDVRFECVVLDDTHEFAENCGTQTRQGGRHDVHQPIGAIQPYQTSDVTVNERTRQERDRIVRVHDPITRHAGFAKRFLEDRTARHGRAERHARRLQIGLGLRARHGGETRHGAPEPVADENDTWFVGPLDELVKRRIRSQRDVVFVHADGIPVGTSRSKTKTIRHVHDIVGVKHKHDHHTVGSNDPEFRVVDVDDLIKLFGGFALRAVGGQQRRFECVAFGDESCGHGGGGGAVLQCATKSIGLVAIRAQ